MIRYLKSDPDTEDRLEDIQSRAVFPCENGEKHRITDLYLPHQDIRELGLPILQWPNRIDSDDGIFSQRAFPSSVANSFQNKC